MEKYVIIADVACDLSKEIRDFAGMDEYVSGHVQISDGRDLPSRLDWNDISREEFYKILSNRRMQVTSAPASPEIMYECFKKYVEQGYKVLSMSLSSKISSTYGVAVVAADRVREEYPDCGIYCFDSYKMSGAFGLLVLYAHLYKKEGRSYEEVIAWLEANKHKVHQMGPIDDLIFVARRGRITMGKAIMGNFAGVKPMGDCSRDGYVSVFTKVKGISKALELTVKYVGKMATDIKDQYIIISHTDREEYAKLLQTKITELYSPKKVFVSDVFPACGTNVGPGMVGVYFMGDELTEDLNAEKEVLLGLLEKK